MASIILKNILSKLNNSSNIQLNKFQWLKVSNNILYAKHSAHTAGTCTKRKAQHQSKILNKETMNQQILKMQFAVKGAVLLRALKHKADMAKGEKKVFPELIYTNQGDCHAMGQKPITFLRQVLAGCTYPTLLKGCLFPEDVKERANLILDACENQTMGSSTHSQGIYIVRKHLAEYMTKRDEGIEADPKNIFITDGASPVIKHVLSLFCNEKEDKPVGIMLPIPLYPLYTAVMTELELYPVNYFLDEDKDWGLDMKEIQRALDESKPYCKTRAIVVINPGNPTGQVLSKKQIKDLIKFAHKEKLVIFADEVYQKNINDEDSEFFSMKRVKHELGPPYDEVELVSFLSVSKGYTGECGIRGGCAEMDCFDEDIIKMMVKLETISICPNTTGQAALSVIAKPPEPNDPSYKQFIKEQCFILDGMAEKGKLVTSKINEIPGLKVNKAQGAMYAMVKIEIPEKAIQDAEKRNLVPDVMWCYDLLDSTGIVVVPGSGFGQKPDTWHFRTTILPPFETMEKVMKGIKTFQESFLKKYGS